MASPPKFGGRRQTARQKLVEAAYSVMSRDGFEGATIANIIDAAQVGVGSFYNHFSSKEDMARAAFSARVDEFGATLLDAVKDVPNAVLANCFAYRGFIDRAEKDKAWASFIVQLEPSMQLFDRMLRRHARVALQHGIDNGDLKIADLEIAITAVHAMEVAMVKAMLDGSITNRQAHKSVFLALSMFGVAAAEASRLSNLSMAELRDELAASLRTKK